VVLFESDEALALDKPAGLSMATRPSDAGAEARVVRALLDANGEARDGREWRLLHRLDVGTSGVVLLARGKEAHRAIAKAFAARRATKTYRGLVWGQPAGSQGLWDDPLARDRRDGRRMEVRADGKAARTRWRVLASEGTVSDLSLTAETGRTHQLRVHCAAHGHPIAGDDLYGGSTLWTRVTDPLARRALAAVARPLLHAERLELPEAGIAAEAPLPTDYVRVLEALGLLPEGVFPLPPQGR
jgi:23S rRNA pseudouridine1911/1915/1917 synthase